MKKNILILDLLRWGVNRQKESIFWPSRLFFLCVAALRARKKTQKGEKWAFLRRFQLPIATSLLFMFAPFFLPAQEMEGSIRYLITHNYTKKMAAVDYISKQQKERLAYMYANRFEWKQYANFYFNATDSKYEDSEEAVNADANNYAWRKEAYTIRHDYANNKVRDIVTVLDKPYIIEDTLIGPNWKILNDMKEVAGHICMNAVWEDTLKKQVITVWFALDMPLSSGPERLCGLPGLILEVDVNNGGMTIVADKIEMKKLDKELEMPKKIKGKKITEAQYREMLRKYIAEKRKAEEPYFWGMRY